MICPLTDKTIDPSDCLENIDIIDGFASDETHMPDIFKAKENYRDICRKCKNHISTWADDNTDTAE